MCDMSRKKAGKRKFELSSRVVIFLGQAKVSVVRCHSRNVLVFVSRPYHLFLKIFERFPTFFV